MFEKTYLDFKTFLKHNLQYKRWNVKLRTISSIMTVEKGRFLYEFDGGGFELKEGESVFLPIGSSYSYKVTTNECLCHQIMFNICDENGPLKLADLPVKSPNGNVAELMKEIVKQGSGFGFVNNFKLTADVYSVLSLFFERVRDSREELQIYNALKIIEERYNEQISVSYLAEVTALSQSQLRRLFQKEIGMSPVEYKNHLRIKKATEMLLYSGQTVCEISQSLGYKNPFVFSRVFKQEKGLSPSEFRKLG
jgi:YesN/AraC family two-component response regulator